MEGTTLMRPGQDIRITHLFRRGYSLDLVSEMGCLYGWTRAEAKAVLAAHGWSLDFSGRLQPQHLRTPAAGRRPTAATAGPELLLNAGIDNESTEIRKAALNVEKAVERLRLLLIEQELRDAEIAAARADLAARQVVSEAMNVVLGVSTPGKSSRVS